MLRVLYIEPFHSGSHARFGETLQRRLPELDPGVSITALTLPGRHWKWRMRGSAAYFAHEHAAALAKGYDVALVSAYCNLAELRGLAPAIAHTPTALYFHENQFAYPTRPLAATPGRNPAAANDQDYGFTQLVSALAAERCVFNSKWNRDSFLDAGRALLRRLPDAKVAGWIDRIEARSEVLGLPLELSEPGSGSATEAMRPAGDASGSQTGDSNAEPSATTDECLTETRQPYGETDEAWAPLIVWNHRWEHDKRPEIFFAALRVLMTRGVRFRVAVCGQRFDQVPPVFGHARDWLPPEAIAHWGFADSAATYRAILDAADIAVSTAGHEFFGVSMIEAAWHGAWPLVPDRLSYPELFPKGHRYADDPAFFDALESAARRPRGALRAEAAGLREMLSCHRASERLPAYLALLEGLATKT